MKINSKTLNYIPFNKPHLTHKEIGYISHAHSLGHLAGDGHYSKRCHEWLELNVKTKKAFLTHSCSTALDMIGLLIDIKPGDEVIMPSFNFTSTANSVALRGGIPVFVDIRPDTLNINENLIENAITPKTKGIFLVHYSGVACEMDELKIISRKHKLYLLEDAAHAILATYKGKQLGSFGDLAAFSFHETKNTTSGEGGALLVNNPKFIERAEIIREKGTNRAKFFRGEVDKYTWVDIGSSFLPSEISAAFLLGQLENSKIINEARMKTWNLYHTSFKYLEKKGYVKRPFIPKYCQHNAHQYFLILNNLKQRDSFIKFLKKRGIMSVFHYVPLHSSPAGKKFGHFIGDMKVTDKISDTLVRLPMFHDLSMIEKEYIIDSVNKFFKNG